MTGTRAQELRNAIEQDVYKRQVVGTDTADEVLAARLNAIEQSNACLLYTSRCV